MYPGGGPEENQGISGSGAPQYPAPQDPFVTDPGYPQPAVPPPPLPPPPLHNPGPPQQPAGAGYPGAGYPGAGHPGAGYAQQGYPPVAPYPAAPAPPPASSSPGQGVVFAVAAVAIFSILAVVGVAVWVVTSNNHPTAGPAVKTSASSAPAPTGRADPVEGLVIGSGSVRVDIYVDYQCPPCSLFEESTGDVLTDYLASERVTLSIHPVAFIDDRSKNHYATRAAAAMACAYESGKGAEFHAYLLEHQPAEDTAGPTDDNLIAAGKSLGLGEEFGACVSGRQRIAWVTEATDAADQYGVSSVPAVYVNDRSVQATKSSLMTAIDNAR